MPVVAAYSALLGLLFVALSVRTLLLRRRLRVALGDGGDERLLRATRVHANFAEYVPLALLLIYLGESSGAPPILVHVLAASLVVGRALHAWGVAHSPERYTYRVVGMALTLSSLGSASLYLAWAAA